MDILIDCINDIVSKKGKTMESFIDEITTNDLKKLKTPLGINGIVVYPSKESATIKKGDDLYVPDLKDKFMLGYTYPSPISKRMEDQLLVEKYKVPEAPVGWYMSEKFDGQRALWDGAKFVTRGSNVNLPRVYPYVPKWFIALMPPGVALDGEFYTNRSSFQELGFLKSKLKQESQRKKGDNTQIELDNKWNNIKYQVFDIISDEPFEKRKERLSKIIKERDELWKSIKLPIYLEKKEQSPVLFTEQYLIKSEKDISNFYEKLISKKAEGVMIRAPHIPYIPRRTRFMLKLKPEEDTECVIVGYKPGEGKYQNMLGAFHCKLENGKTFYVSGMDDNIRKNYLKTHPIGTKITVLYTFLTDDNIPRHPRYKGIPNDR